MSRQVCFPHLRALCRGSTPTRLPRDPPSGSRVRGAPSSLRAGMDRRASRWRMTWAPSGFQATAPMSWGRRTVMPAGPRASPSVPLLPRAFGSKGCGHSSTGCPTPSLRSPRARWRSWSGTCSHRFCGKVRYGARRSKKGERARECPACGSLSYPRISPASHRGRGAGGRILLARAASFPHGLHSVLAGYVEPGETLEECVHREVREETGIEISNLRYFGKPALAVPSFPDGCLHR